MTELSPDIQYLMSEDIGKVIAEGFSAVYRAKPNHPIDFLAKWLLNNCATKVHQAHEKTVEDDRRLLVEKFIYYQENQKKEEDKKRAALNAQEKIENDFREKLKNHNYHNELIATELPNFIQKQKKFPGVYIGQLEHPPKKVTDDEDEESAHLDQNQEKRIIYIGSSENHTFLLNKQLEPLKGVTYDAFAPIEEDPPQFDADGNELPRKEKEIYKYFPDVTQEPKIFFFRIPKLGAYYHVPLTYKSCLLEEALDNGVAERKRVREIRAQQQREWAEAEEAYKKELEEATAAGEEDRIEMIEENWKNKQATFVEEKEEPFRTTPKQLVLCVDTLGEDREISLEDRKYLEDLAKFFTKTWEDSEARQLSRDIDLQIESLEEVDRTTYANDFITAQETEISNKLSVRYESDPPELDDNVINQRRGVYLIDFLRRSLMEEQTINRIKKLKEFRVIKFKQVLQNAFYLIGYKKDEINIPGTNVLNWKQTKNLIDDAKFFKRLEQYIVVGAKVGKIEKYAYINRILRRLSAINGDDVDEYNVGLGVLFRFIKSAAEVRVADILRRRQEKNAARELRETLIREEEIRKQTRVDQLEQARNAYNEVPVPDPNAENPEQPVERPPFNEEEFLAKFDAENPEKIIPPEVEDDIDDDFENETSA